MWEQNKKKTNEKPSNNPVVQQVFPEYTDLKHWTKSKKKKKKK